MAASYGGYTNTSYGAKGGENDGGFVFGGSQQGSQGGQGGGKVRTQATTSPFKPLYNITRRVERKMEI